MEKAFEMIIPLFASLGVFILIGFIVWVVNRTRREKNIRMIELQSRMLEKFASSQEFAGFLRTSEGQRYLSGLASEPRKDPKEKVIKSVKTGVVLVVFAVGLITVSYLAGFETPTQEPPFVIGFLAMFLGFGFLAAAAVSYFLSKAWGLFPDEQDRVASSNP